MEANKNITVIPARKRVGNTVTAEEKPKLRVAAYCRVSTDSDEQASSYEVQVEHYTQFIQKNPEWELAGIFADDGISGCNTKKRSEFIRMIEECMAGRIDMIITKSISRFARNTLDCLKYIRELKEKNIPVFFEKEYIETVLYLILTPNTGLFFVYCSIYCGFVGDSEPAHCGLSLICRLNMQDGMERYRKINAKQSPVWIEFLTRLCYTDICIIVSISNRQE